MINHFTGKYRFLSNFYPCEVWMDGYKYSSVEHGYVAAKTHDDGVRKQIQLIEKAGDVKRLGRKIELRDGWELIKLVIMKVLLRQKFTEPRLRQLLVETGDEELVEGNTWHDNFWGSCACDKCAWIQGENHLGKLLMKIRSEICK